MKYFPRKANVCKWPLVETILQNVKNRKKKNRLSFVKIEKETENDRTQWRLSFSTCCVSLLFIHNAVASLRNITFRSWNHKICQIIKLK